MKWLDRLFGGPKDMAALPAGTKAPEISLPALERKRWRQILIAGRAQQGPVLAAFYKVSCPVCQYTFPFLERLHKAYGDRKITIVGISQNKARNRRLRERVRRDLPQLCSTIPTAMRSPMLTA